MFCFLLNVFLVAGHLKKINKKNTFRPTLILEPGTIASFRSFSVNLLPIWLRKADQWKPDYHLLLSTSYVYFIS